MVECDSNQNEIFFVTMFVSNRTFLAKAIKKDVFPNFNQKDVKISSFIS